MDESKNHLLDRDAEKVRWNNDYDHNHNTSLALGNSFIDYIKFRVISIPCEEVFCFSANKMVLLTFDLIT